MSAVVVIVPEGLYPGDEFIIEVGGREWTVDVPDGAYAGHEIEMILPLDDDSSSSDDTMYMEEEPLENSLVVMVPEQCGPGDAFVVETMGPSGESFTFETIVPDSCYGGMELVVQVPPPPPPPPPPLSEGKGDGGKRGERLRAALAHAEGGYDDELHVEDPDVTVLRESRVGHYSTFQKLEVYRSDGSWSRGATVEEYDEFGDTYTVRTSDGRLKYMVEPPSLRSVRVGLGLSLGEAVLCSTRAGKVYGHVDEYDDTENQYTVRLVSNGTYRIVIDDEIETVNLAHL